MRTGKRTSRLAALALAFIIAVFGVGLPDSVHASLTDSEQDKIDDYRNEKAELDEKIRENQEKLDALKGDIEKQETYVATLQDQIDAYQRQIDVQNAKIEELEKEKASLQAKIDELQAEIDEIEVKINHITIEQIGLREEINETVETLKDSLCSLYMYGKTSELELLLNANDFRSYLVTKELEDNLAGNADEIIEDLKEKSAQMDALIAEQNQLIADREADQASLQADIDTLNARETEIEATKAEIQSSQDEVQELKTTAMGYIAELNEASAAYKSLVKKYEDEKAALDAEIEYIIAEAAKRSQPKTFTPSGNFIMPLQYGDAYTSSGYGYRSLSVNYSTFHGGVDLCCWSGTLGKIVSATAAGQVIYSGFNGYGNCVMIDHGNGIVSLYGHMNSRAVGVGETVYQGQTVGYAGNTFGPGGWSTGPHLHFEIRVNGSKVNPGAYVALP